MLYLNIDKKGGELMSIFAKILEVFGLGAAKTGSQACLLALWDEPECPKSLIK